jgi:glycosyltransferase involved in cell wall biosynthesis
MKILVDPVYTHRSMKRCATFYSLKKLAEAILREIPDSYVYYVIPNEKWAIIDDGIDSDRAMPIKLETYRDRYKEYYLVKDEWAKNFSFWGRYSDWDVILTTKTVGIPSIRLLSEKSQKSERFVFVFESLPLMNFKATVSIHPLLQLQTLTGYLCSDLVAMNTKYEYDEIFELARKWLAPVMLRRLDEVMKVKFLKPQVDYNYPFEKLERIKNEKKENLIVVYTQRLDKTERQPHKVFKSWMYDFVFDSSNEYIVTTNALIGNETNVYNLGFITGFTPEREKFYEFLKKSDVYFSFAIEEGLPLSLVEATAHGVIGVVIRKKWSLDLYGSEYPFMVSNEAEAVGVLRRLKKNYKEEYYRFIDWYKKHFLKLIEDRGDCDVWLVDKLKEWEERRKKEVIERGDSENSLSKVVNDYVEKGGIRRFEMWDLVKKLSDEDMTNNDFVNVERRDMFDVPLFRCVSFYETIVKLKYLYGWENDLEPLTLKKVEVKDGEEKT